MGRDNTVRLSDSEHEAVIQAKKHLFGDDSVPYGVAVRRACEELVNND